jgi:tetratricopeptide (TPR) repeat protein
MSTEAEARAKELLQRAENARTDAAAWLAAATALAHVGEKTAADAAFKHYVTLAPGRQELANGAELHRQGDYNGAAVLYRQALASDPKNVDALRLLGVACSLLGLRAEAEDSARRAVALAPNYSQAWVDFGTVLSDLGKREEAVQAFLRAVSLRPNDQAAHVRLGHALVIADEIEMAERAYRKALEMRQDDPYCLMGLGHALKTLGRTEEAITCYRSSLAIDPTLGEAWWALADLKTYRFSEKDRQAMEQLLAIEGLSPISRANAAYALGKACEDAGQYDEAFARYAHGAEVQRAQVRYDRAATRRMISRIKSIFTGEFLQSHEGHGSDDASPIFIVGSPRSGSTLIEQILASHSNVDGAGELPIVPDLISEITSARSDGLAYPEAVRLFEPSHFKMVGEAYIQRALRYRGSGAFFTDKLPQNFASIGLILLALPNAKIIDARRHPLDSCFGTFKQMFARGQEYSYDLSEIGDFYLDYDSLMRHWDEVAPGRVLRVDYEDVVLDLDGQTRRLLAYCGLPFEDSCVRFYESARAVNTASSEQVRRPLYKSSLGAWRRFAGRLRELEVQLAPAIDALPRHIRDAGGGG